MTCERIQAEISGALDERELLSAETTAHLESCADCREFRSTSIDLSRRYSREVRAGIDRLRRLENPVLPRRPMPLLRLLVPLAAAVLLCWLGMGRSRVESPASPAPSIALTRISPVPPPSRARLLEDRSPFDEEVSFVLDLEPGLPRRLDQEFLPERSDLGEIRLPLSLRF